MTDHANPHHIRHDADGTQAVPVAPDAAQAHASIAAALADPFAWSVALLTDGVVRMPAKPAELMTTQPVSRRPAKARRPASAAEIMAPRPGFSDLDIGPLSNRSRRG